MEVLFVKVVLKTRIWAVVTGEGKASGDREAAACGR